MGWKAVLIIFCLLGIFLQDIKYREVHIVLFAGLFGLSGFLGYCNYKMFIVQIFLYNTAFFVLTFLLLIAYMSLKAGYYNNPFTNYFGLGDVFFYVSVTPLFMLRNYIVFFILSLVFAIVAHLTLKKIMVQKTIPLAGYAALLLLCIAGYEFMTNNFKITIFTS